MICMAFKQNAFTYMLHKHISRIFGPTAKYIFDDRNHNDLLSEASQE